MGFREADPARLFAVYHPRLKTGQQEQTTIRLQPALLFNDLAKRSNYEIIRHVASALSGVATFSHPDGGERIAMRRSRREATPGIFEITASYRGHQLTSSEVLREKTANFLSASLVNLPLSERLFVVMEKQDTHALYAASLSGFYEYQGHLAPLIGHDGSLWRIPLSMKLANAPISQLPDKNRSITAESVWLRQHR